MLDILKKFYKIEIKKYNEYDENITFFYNDNKYYFVKKNNSIDINECYKIFLTLKNNFRFMHDFVFNKYNELVSEGYVLFKLNYIAEEVELDDIYRLNNLYLDRDINYISMDEFWYKKIDYIEKQVYELSDIKLINYSIDYFVGISELLILFLKNNYKVRRVCYVHRNYNILNPLDFYNPLNIMVGDYYKDIISYIYLKKDWNFFESLIKNVSINDLYYIFVRMCFPFIYFDLLSDVILNKKEESKMISFINNISEYQTYLMYVEEVCGIKLFEWIKKE